MTSELAQCSKCAALLNDADDDIAKHRRWHTQQEDASEAVRRVASNASTDAKNLAATVRDYQRPQLTQTPATVSIRVTDPDELEPDESDHVIDVELDNTDEETDPRVGEPNPAYTTIPDYPLAIDRDDDLDARIANATGTQPTI